MSVERRVEQKKFEHITFRTKIKPFAYKREIPPIADKIIGHWTETHGLGTIIDYKDGQEAFANSYMEAIRQGYFPVIVGNHDSNSNAVSLIKLSYILAGSANDILPEERRIEGFMLPLAESMDSGRQGQFAKKAYDGTKPIIEKYGIVPILTPTKNDQTRRGMQRDPKRFMADMRNGVKQGYAIAILAEGTVEGGRRGPDGKRKGMQEFIDIALETPFVLAKRYKRQPTVFIPVGIENGTEILDHARKIPLHLNGFIAGFGFADVSIGRLHVGIPIKSNGPEIGEMVDNHDWKGVNDYVGKEVASLIPEKLRGVYA